MKFSPAQQLKLLELANIDQQISAAHSRLTSNAQQSSVMELHRQLAQCNGDLNSARTALEQSAVELRRLENDVELVEKRLAVDEQRLNTTSSPKDAEGISHEITSLKARLSSLEDTELQHLEARDALQSSVDLLVAQQQTLQQKLAETEREESQQATELNAQVAQLRQGREAKVAEIDPELAAIYERKLQRGVAATRLSGRDCGACHLALTAATYDDVMAMPAEDLATCPHCQAVIVR